MILMVLSIVAVLSGVSVAVIGLPAFESYRKVSYGQYEPNFNMVKNI